MIEQLNVRESTWGRAQPVTLSHAEPAAPAGVVNIGGEWYYDEYAHGSGVSSLGIEEAPAPQPDEEERKSILDLFKR